MEVTRGLERRKGGNYFRVSERDVPLVEPALPAPCWKVKGFQALLV